MMAQAQRWKLLVRTLGIALLIGGWSWVFRNDELDYLRARLPYYGLDLELFWNDMVCSKIRRFGASGDGGWDVCADDRTKIPPGALVLSFGIRTDDSFDRHINAETDAVVHMFDPTHFVDIDLSKHTPAMHFHRWGLAHADQRSGQYPYLTIGTIRDDLKVPAEAIIEVLKVDIEHNEWSALRQACESGEMAKVRQLAVEFHVWPGNEDLAVYLEQQRAVIRCLGKAGFRFITFHENHSSPYMKTSAGRYIRQCFEMTAININLLKPHSPPSTIPT